MIGGIKDVECKDEESEGHGLEDGFQMLDHRHPTSLNPEVKKRDHG